MHISLCGQISSSLILIPIYDSTLVAHPGDPPAAAVAPANLPATEVRSARCTAPLDVRPGSVVRVLPHTRAPVGVPGPQSTSSLLAPESRGQGLATEATRLTLDWAFHLAHLRMVWLKVLAPNTAGITAYQRAGFRQAGRLRQAGYWLGEVVDELLMDAVRADFPGPSAVRDTFGS